jgi:hypothetical protein
LALREQFEGKSNELKIDLDNQLISLQKQAEEKEMNNLEVIGELSD